MLGAIQAHARLAPNRTAVVFNNNTLSYRQFARLIDSARRYLVSQGIGGSGFTVLAIASLLDAWMVGLAVRSLGLTTVIVHSREEIGRLGLPETSCVVTTEAERPVADETVCAQAGWRHVVVPRAVFAGATTRAGSRLREPAAQGGHVLLTSGTTGIYKKILIDPSCERALIDYRKTVFAFGRRSVVNVFNFGGWTIIGYLTAATVWDVGGCAILYQGPNKHESFRHRGITHSFLIPRMLMELLAAPATALHHDGRMRLFVGGGPLPAALAEAARTRLTPRLYTWIGSTEASAFTLTPVAHDKDLRWHRIIPSRKVEIVDEMARPVPTGQVGHVRTATIGGISGYLHDEAASRAFFRDGFFYPGDLGVIAPDGRLALHGRVTDVINILGNKFAPEPIEDALCRKLQATGVCVFSMPHESGDEIVHVAIEASRPIAPAALASALTSALPGVYRAQFHVMDALPRNTMGKVQRDALKRALGLPA